jgi:hypothetical protein
LGFEIDALTTGLIEHPEIFQKTTFFLNASWRREKGTTMARAAGEKGDVSMPTSRRTGTAGNTFDYGWCFFCLSFSCSRRGWVGREAKIHYFG